MLRFDPFRDLDRVTEALLGAPAGSARVPRFMPMDVYKAGDHFVLHADLPGVNPGSISVDVDHGVLTIRAERTQRGGEDVEWIVSERFTGTYQRQLSLGDNIDAEKIKATYENGVLTVELPVTERAKPRKIEIETAGESKTIEAGSGS